MTYSEPEPELDQGDKSGSRFFVSHDRNFVIKSMDSEAVAELHSILRSYHEVHCVFSKRFFTFLENTVRSSKLKIYKKGLRRVILSKMFFGMLALLWNYRREIFYYANSSFYFSM